MIDTEGDRIKRFRKKLGVKQGEFAERIGVSQAYLSDIERGTKGVSANVLRGIAEAYDADLYWLLMGKETRGVVASVAAEPVTTYTRGNFFVPVSAQAGYLGDWTQEWIDQNLKPVSIPGLGSGIFRTFEVSGESMMPTIRDGDMVVGRRLNSVAEIRPNRVHVVVSGLQGLYIKRLLVSDGSLILESDNQQFRPIVMDGEEVREIYYAVMRLTASFSGPRPENSRLDHMERFLAAEFQTFRPFDMEESPMKTPRQ